MTLRDPVAPENSLPEAESKASPSGYGSHALVALPPTAATLLRCERSDGRSVLTILASDVVVARTMGVIAATLGFETNLALLTQRAGAKAVAQLGIAVDLWVSGASVRSETISGAHLALGPLVIGCLTPLALTHDLTVCDAPRQIAAAGFALFGSLACALMARQDPERFERVAQLAHYRGVPLGDVYLHVSGETVHTAAHRLAEGWGLPRELSLALGGPEGEALSAEERAMVAALDLATVAARQAAVALEPWPYVGASDSIEDFALTQALSLRARRIATRLQEALPETRPDSRTDQRAA